ncbi:MULTISPECIES: PaaX family transcriptional regulator [Anoxybacillaceae]|uniref:PaaX family transcriptional regulator C-terminal domain-containing protein n=1 Tax=Anoxybacteroides rupiense TaxID=311460 RepID=A0ABD5J1E5_9BACL|nr:MULTISPECIES: PaaX family transcriptional regulator C-terminal domain-containing protein [Anoxybacillus]MBB3909384.1 phenylacetic acid degradation operon negative regulatory protein [Anoxybacillus rupiensis]MED5053800.1 PaaX family transcriptional regulator C-terminal domain-containing protein [Anoxybacillus rupiensis]OQM45481.1 phenylacetic acid degradation operon negative regulatory protein PaaX [Anoxybacillus sp. UARK-01]
MKPRALMFTLFGEYIQHYGNEVWIGSLIQMMSHFGISESSIRGAALRMVQQEFFEVRKIGNNSYYSLTPKGKRTMTDGFIRVYSLKNYKWDGYWRILTYSVPEEKRELRNQIRKELSLMGFGLISHGTWASPNPVEQQVMELIRDYHLDPYVILFTSSSIVSHSHEQLIKRGWDFAQIAKEYDRFIDTYQRIYEEFQRRAWNNELSDRECFIERTKLVHEYRSFFFMDPSFPHDLLPDNWSGTKARELFFNVHQLLAVPAIRYFETLFESAPDREPQLNREKAINPFIGMI